MSLYNMMHGQHPLAPELLGSLGYTIVTFAKIPRFRDIFLFPGDIRILTRTGGGNRGDYVEGNDALKAWPGYLRDWDDAFDSTFAWWAYKWPDGVRERKALTMTIEAIKENKPALLPESLEKMTYGAIEQIRKSNPPA